MIKRVLVEPSGLNDILIFLKRREVFCSAVLRSFPSLKQRLKLNFYWSNVDIDTILKEVSGQPLVTHIPIRVIRRFLRITHIFGLGYPNQNGIDIVFVGSGKGQNDFIIVQVAVALAQINSAHVFDINQITMVNSKKIKRKQLFIMF